MATTEWCEKLLRDKCPHMFDGGRWRIGWSDTLSLMAMAAEAAVAESVRLRMDGSDMAQPTGNGEELFFSCDCGRQHQWRGNASG